MSIFAQERSRNLATLVSDLQSEVRRLQAQLLDEQRKRREAEANVARLRRNANKPRVVPSGDMESGYECPNKGCWTALSEDYSFCHGCGCEIDWHPEPDVSFWDSLRDRMVDERMTRRVS